MKRILRGLLFLLAASAFGQQPAVPPYPPGGTPPTFPPELSRRQQMPPETKAPPPRALSNAQIEQKIQDRLKSESELANANLSVKSDAKSIQLTGAVDTDYQHDLALRVAQEYSGDRRIVDKITVRRRTRNP